MNPTPALDIQNLLALMLTFARVGSLMLTAPILGSRQVPLKMRLLLAGFVALAIHPLLTRSAVIEQRLESINGQQLAALMPTVFSEIAIGIMLGLGVLILVAIAKTAGTVIGQLAGMQWTTDADTETAEPISAISQLFGVLSIAIFVMIGGPEMVLSALLDSYRSIPCGIGFSPEGGLRLLGELLQQSFWLTLRGVAPAIAALLISTITIGMLSRAFPFMNMLGLGFNSNQFIFLLAVFLTMGGSVWLFMDDVGGVLHLVQQRLAEAQ
jgi:flagellar biosynthetic protein FliR